MHATFQVTVTDGSMLPVAGPVAVR